LGKWISTAVEGATKQVNAKTSSKATNFAYIIEDILQSITTNQHLCGSGEGNRTQRRKTVAP